MTVEQTDVVDIISTDKLGRVVLTISDHLDWSDSLRHQTILQAKFNAYLGFVESGEILESYPRAVGRQIVFKVAFKFKPDKAGMEFLSNAKSVIESAGFSVHHKVFHEHSDGTLEEVP